MKFAEIFRFEFTYQVRRLWTWLFAAALLVVTFLMTRDNAAAESLPDELFVNSPFLIVTTTVVGTLLWMMMAASVAGDASARDVATRIYPLLYTTSITRAEYLGGRFLAAFILNALILLAVQAGIVIAIYSPGIDSEVIGPFRPAAFITPYAFISLPNAFVATALQFLLANISGRAMAAYFGSFLLFFMGFFVASFLLYKNELGTLLDPIGIRFIVEDIARMWTTVEKRDRLLSLEGIVLTNRVFWVGIGVILLILNYLTFRFAHRKEMSTWWLRFLKHRQVAAAQNRDTGVNESPGISILYASRKFGFLMQLHQTFSIALASFRLLATSIPGLFLLIAIPLMVIPVVVDQMFMNGVPFVPTTIRVISELTAPLSAELSRWVVIPALIIFFSGELVWRERESGIHEMTDTMPGSEWPPFLGKFAGLALLLITFTAMQMGAAMIAQSLMDFKAENYRAEILLYVKILFGLQLPEYLLFSVLTLTIHVLANQKYTAHLIATMAYVFIAIPDLFGVEHSLLIYSAGPQWSYTEMRGFDPSFWPWLWFKAYWFAWALFLAIVARLFWVRGKETSLKVRFDEARHRLIKSTGWLAGLTIMLIMTLGMFIFYNTNVLNKYLTTTERKERQAEYERRYERYAGIPQPEPAKVKLHIEIYPDRREAQIHGSYHMINRSEKPIDSIHVATVPGVETRTSLDLPATLGLSDEYHGHQIYKMSSPLLPGDSVRLNFEVNISSRGFRHHGVDPSIVRNGTFFQNKNWFPSLGYQRVRELMTASDRREHGLDERPLIAFLNDENAYKERGHGIIFEAVIGTNSNQVAVAPGMLRRTWTVAAGEKNSSARRYFQFSTASENPLDGMIGNEWSFFSANYAMHESVWTSSPFPHQTDSIHIEKGISEPSSGDRPSVRIFIYHDPRHTHHLQRMLRAIHASLNYYTSQFGPLKYNNLTIVERPGLGGGMHADAGMISHAEGFTQWNPRDDSRSHDHPFAIVTHEVAHQWTVPFAFVEGAPVMSESIAWYYGMKAIEHSKGPEALRKLLDFMREPHPYSPIRRGEPLLRALDPYMSYRKGPFALYTLSEYLGEEKVNRALRDLLEKHSAVDAPLATTLDLYHELNDETPDSLKYLLHDLFEVNTFWKLKARKATTRMDKDQWLVTLEIESHKEVIDAAGVKTEVPLDEWMDVGVFGPSANQNSAPELYRQRHRIRTGIQTITMRVAGLPARAGVDPYHVLNWEERSEVNMKDIKPE